MAARGWAIFSCLYAEKTLKESLSKTQIQTTQKLVHFHTETYKVDEKFMRQFQCVPTTYVTENKETFFEMYTKQVSCSLAFLF